MKSMWKNGRGEMMKSTYYRECRDCGANLDPGEICDCRRQPQIPIEGTEDSTKKYFKSTKYLGVSRIVSVEELEV